MQRNASYHRRSHRSLYLDNPCAADGLQPLRPLSHLILTIKTRGRISRSARKVALAFCGRREGPIAVAPISKQSHLGEELAMHLAHAVRHGGNEDILVGGVVKETQRSDCMETRTRDDPCCHSRDFWTARGCSQRALLWRKWRIVSPVMRPE